MDYDLFYVCWLVEYLARYTKNHRKDIVNKIGYEGLKSIYELADVWHCLPINRAVAEIIEDYRITDGNFDNSKLCRHAEPSEYDIAGVYTRLIQNTLEDNKDLIRHLLEVFNSELMLGLEDYNSALFYSTSEYLALSYKEGYLL